MHIGCNIGGIFYNILAYADDIVLIAPSWSAMQLLINALHDESMSIDMIINVKKTCCMVFHPTDKHKSVSHNFKQFMLNGTALLFVSKFKYFGHVLSCNLRDDADISRETRNLYIQANVLSRRFHACSKRVKLRLFKSFCLCLYGSALWENYSCTVMNSFKSAYSRCMKMLFSYRKYDSVTNMLLATGLPSFSTVLFNYRISFMHSWLSSCNFLVNHYVV
jgi:hypothetical protein